MAIPSLVKTVTLAGRTLLQDGQVTAPIGSTDDAVIYRLVAADWGSVGRNTFKDDRPLLDGARRRGAVHGTRQVALVVELQVNPEVIGRAYWERARDQAWQELDDLTAGYGGPVALVVTGEDHDGNATSRTLTVERTSIGGGGLGMYDRGHGPIGHYADAFAQMVLQFEALFPWWVDTESTRVINAQTLDGTLRTGSVTNTGSWPCPVRVELRGSGTVTVALLNATSGAESVTVGGGITLTSLPMVNTSSEIYAVDQYVTDPQVWSATETVGGTSIRPYVDPAPKLWLRRGSNTLSWQVTSGVLTSGLISVYRRRWWSNPVGG